MENKEIIAKESLVIEWHKMNLLPEDDSKTIFILKSYGDLVRGNEHICKYAIFGYFTELPNSNLRGYFKTSKPLSQKYNVDDVLMWAYYPFLVF